MTAGWLTRSTILLSSPAWPTAEATHENHPRNLKT